MSVPTRGGGARCQVLPFVLGLPARAEVKASDMVHCAQWIATNICKGIDPARQPDRITLCIPPLPDVVLPIPGLMCRPRHARPLKKINLSPLFLAPLFSSKTTFLLEPEECGSCGRLIGSESNEPFVFRIQEPVLPVALLLLNQKRLDFFAN